MLSGLARMMLTASAIAPVSLVYAWVSFMQDEMLVAATAAGVALSALAACLTVLRVARKELERLPFSAQEIEPADSENIGFMLLYILPLFTDKINTLNWGIWVPIIAIFSVITATGYGYHFNPLLGLLRWHFYKITSKEGVTYVLITKKHIRKASQNLKVGQLTEYILLDLES